MTFKEWAAERARVLPKWDPAKGGLRGMTESERWQRYLSKWVVRRTRDISHTCHLLTEIFLTCHTQGVSMQKRTFFMFSVKDGKTKLVERYTCDDVREALLVEQVDARLTGKPVSIDTLTEQFPDAVRGAHYWSVMKTQAKTDDTLKGPYMLCSDLEPTEAELLAWFKENKAVPAEAAPAAVLSKSELKRQAATKGSAA
jgi:hypothetical protein